MKALCSWLMALSCIALFAWADTADAQQVRAVVLTKQTSGAAARDASALEAAAVAALTARGARIVDLDMALLSQKALFSDMVQAGKLPEALSTLNADALVSVQLACDKSTERVMGSALDAYFCALSTKVVRVDSGEVVFARTEPVPSHGLNEAMAVQSSLRERVPTLLRSQHDQWLATWSGAAGWTVDLMIGGVPDLSTRERLREGIARLPGLSAVTLVYFRDGVAKLSLSGKGAEELERLPHALEQGELALRVTREAGRTLHAVFDATKAYARDAVLYVELPAQLGPDRELVQNVGPELLQTALLGLPYLRPVHSRAVTGEERPAGSIVRLARRTRGAAPVLAVVARMLREPPGTWRTVLTVTDASGVSVASGSGFDPELDIAVQAAARSLEQSMMAVLSRAEARARLGLSQAPWAPPKDALVVERLHVERGRDVLLEVRNTSGSLLSDCSVELNVAGVPVGRAELPSLAPGASHRAVVPLDGLPSGLERDSLVDVSARVRYLAGEVYADTQVATVWMRQPAHGSDDDEQEAKGDHRASRAYLRITRQGVAASRAGQWQRAKGLFLAAHSAYPNARTLRALGMVSFDLGEDVAAERYLRQALASSVRPLTPAMQAQVRALLDRIARARASVGSVASR